MGPRNLEDLLPLTPMQRLMLLHSLTPGGSVALHNQIGYEIEGRLDEPAFGAAWQRLVQRHSALRTAFLWKGLKEPVQAVRTDATMPMRSVVAPRTDPESVSACYDDLRRADTSEPFSLGRAPLMRGVLLRISDERWRFLLNVHHLVVDRWSHGLLLGELSVLYSAAVRGEPGTLPEARGFREYIAWLSRRDVAAAEGYWRDALAGIEAPTLLLGSATRREVGERRTSTRPLSPGTTAQLRECAARWRTSLGAVVLAAIGVAAARRLRRDDVVLGLTVSGRPPDLDGSESIVGSFVNNVPLRLSIDRARPIADWIRGLQRDQMRRQAFDHESLRDVREWSAVPHSQPLFDTLVLLNLDQQETVRLGDAELRPLDASLDAAYPLLLAVGIDGPSLVVSLVHDADAAGVPLVEEVVAALAAIATSADEARVERLLGAASEHPVAAAAPVRDAGGRNGARRPANAVDAEALLALWRETLGNPAIGIDDDFFEAGGTSMQALELLVRLERLTGRPVPIGVLFEGGSVRSALSALGAAQAPAGSLVGTRRGGSRPPIVAVPGLGGNVVSLAGLARALGPDQPFHALHSPGLDGSEAPLTSIESVADRFADQIYEAVDQPSYLVGFCWGAAVAFEIGRRLADRGRPVLSLGLIDPAALLRTDSSGSGSAGSEFVRRRVRRYRDEWQRRDWRSRGAWLAQKARRAVVALSARERAERRAEYDRFNVMRANREAILRYEPERYHGPATVFITSGRDVAPGEDPRLEWLQLIEPQPAVVYVPGADSGDALSPANVAELATVLRGWTEARAGQTSPS